MDIFFQEKRFLAKTIFAYPVQTLKDIHIQFYEVESLPTFQVLNLNCSSQKKKKKIVIADYKWYN